VVKHSVAMFYDYRLVVESVGRGGCVSAGLSALSGFCWLLFFLNFF
jgi:hypothetical protein